MADIITMSDQLYALASMRFNMAFINTVAAGSAFNPYGKVVGPTSVYWSVDLTFAQMNGSPDAEDGGDALDELEAFLLNLQGGKVLARIYNKARTTLKGAGGPSPTLNVAADALAGATSITLKNLTASQSIAIKKSDMLGIGENLYKASASVGSDGSGNATVNIQPPLRLGVATDDPVNTQNATGLFRLQSGGTDLTIMPPIISQNFTLSFIEEPDVG